jgi:hypothetical protein
MIQLRSTSIVGSLAVLVFLAACTGGNGGAPAERASPSPSPTETGQPEEMAVLCEHLDDVISTLDDIVSGAITDQEASDLLFEFQQEVTDDAEALAESGDPTLEAIAEPVRDHATHIGQARVGLQQGDYNRFGNRIEAATDDVDDMVTAGLYCPEGIG